MLTEDKTIVRHHIFYVNYKRALLRFSAAVRCKCTENRIIIYSLHIEYIDRLTVYV